MEFIEAIDASNNGISAYPPDMKPLFSDKRRDTNTNRWKPKSWLERALQR